ncbi:MAG: N-acetylmuramoyl-L-alanine amidase [Elusimicrobia bacterium]|nr:N-acetylmuramoyl-L-alanine amidase [Elusimicrobiota bacterium]
MRASLALALVLIGAAVRAEDAGQPVTFGSRASESFPVQAFGAGPRVVFDSGDSDPVSKPWNTVLIQGFLPDPSVSFEAERVGAASGWRPLEVHRFPNGRFWARARAAQGTGPLRLRALDAGASRDHVVDVYSVEAFVSNPETPGPAIPPSRGPRNLDAQRPFVHPRAEWKAVPATEPYTPDPLPWRITLHHSDGRYTRTLQESLDEVHFIQDFHIHGRGWIDIAYHFAVDPLGNIIEGRPEGMLGAHTLDDNEGNVGIVLLGDYQPPVNDRPTAPQLAAVAALGRYLVARYGIFPDALKGHRDYKVTDCPGDRAYATLPALRRALANTPQPGLARARRAAAALSGLAGGSFDAAATSGR